MPLRFDPDSLDGDAWETIERLDREWIAPDGAPFPAGTSLLQRLAEYAAWGLFAFDEGWTPGEARPNGDEPYDRLDPDGIPDWDQ